MTKHTKGPWIIDNRRVMETKEKLGTVICEVESVFTSHTVRAPATIGEKHPDIDVWKAESEANKNLICAAPDLLEALKGLITWTELTALPLLKDEGFSPKGLESWKQAIAKAEGR